MNDNQNEPAPKSENEIADYYDGVKSSEIQIHETGIKKARSALYVTAALLLVGEIISLIRSGIEPTPLAIGIIAIEVGIFVGLALWTKTKPFTAIIVGIILFILIWVASVAVAEQPIYSGIVMKGIIIFFLVSALKPAKAWENLKKNN